MCSAVTLTDTSHETERAQLFFVSCWPLLRQMFGVSDLDCLDSWRQGTEQKKKMRTDASKKQLSISGSLGRRTLVCTYSLTQKTIVSLFPMLFTYSVGDPSSPQISLQCIQSPAPAQAVIFQSEFKWTSKHAESEWRSMWCCCLHRNIVHPARLFDVYLWFFFPLVPVVKTQFTEATQCCTVH